MFSVRKVTLNEENYASTKFGFCTSSNTISGERWSLDFNKVVCLQFKPKSKNSQLSEICCFGDQSGEIKLAISLDLQNKGLHQKYPLSWILSKYKNTKIQNQKNLLVTIKVPLGHRCHSNPTVKAPLTTHLKLTTVLKKLFSINFSSLCNE